MPSVYEIVTEKIIKQLESGVAPWRKPWTCQTPANLITQKEYRGLNVFTLASQGFPSRFWLTFNQATNLGGRISKGEKSSPVIFWNVGEELETTTQDGKKDFPAFSGPVLQRLQLCADGRDRHSPFGTLLYTTSAGVSFDSSFGSTCLQVFSPSHSVYLRAKCLPTGPKQVARLFSLFLKKFRIVLEL